MVESMNAALLGCQPSGIRRFTALAKAEPGCLFLTIGEPDFSTPEPIKEATKTALDQNLTHYPPGAGELYLRKRISRFEQEQNGVSYSPEEILVVDGATEGLYLALRGILNPGDEVIVPTPAFGLYEPLVALSSGVYVPMDTCADHFQITPQNLAQHITAKSKAILLNSPNNPTGAVYSRETLLAIADIARIGLPSMIEQLCMRVGMIVYAKTVASLGTVMLACHQVCMNILSLTFMTGQAFAVSATSLVGQSLGKLRADMAVLYSRRTQVLGTAVSVVLMVVLFFFGEPIIRLYSDDASIIEQGAFLLKMVALIQPLQSTQFILTGSLRGAGDTKYTAKVIFVTVMLVRPLIALFSVYVLRWGLTGAWIALVADQCLRTLLITLRYQSGKWKTVLKPDLPQGKAESAAN